MVTAFNFNSSYVNLSDKQGGILISGESYLDITGNTISDSYGPGISVNQSSATLKSNQLLGNTRTAIEVVERWEYGAKGIIEDSMEL